MAEIRNSEDLERSLADRPHEGEIAFAKRIEAGRATMIGGICESPLTYQALAIWREELLEEKILLRDVIDLETTFGESTEDDEMAQVTPGEAAGTEDDAEGYPDGSGDDSAGRAPAPTATKDEDEGSDADKDGDDEDAKANLLLAAMEAALKPAVLETLDSIAHTYETLRDMQTRRIDAALSEEASFSTGEELDYQRMRNEMIEKVHSLHLNNNRIEALIDQIYGINRRLMMLEGQLMKMADHHGVNRRDFIEEYRGSELDPGWIDRIGLLPGKGWARMVEHERVRIESVRAEIGEIGQHVGIDISEYRRIVDTVQKGEKEISIAKTEMVEANFDAALTSVELRAALADFELDDLARLMRMVPFVEDLKPLDNPLLEKDRANKLSELADAATSFAQDVKDDEKAHNAVPLWLTRDLGRYAAEAVRPVETVRPGWLWELGAGLAGGLKDDDIEWAMGPHLFAKLERLVGKHLDLMRDYFAATLARTRPLDQIEIAPDATPEAMIGALGQAVEGLDSGDWGDTPPPDPEIPAVMANRVEELEGILDRLLRTTDEQKRADLERTFWRRAKAAAMTVLRYGVRSMELTAVGYGVVAGTEIHFPASFQAAVNMIRELLPHIPWPF